MNTIASNQIRTIPSNHEGPFHVGAMRLFLLDWNGKRHVVRDYCSHRQGPLSLGICQREKGTIVCPWHGKRTQVERLLDRAWPAVRAGGVISFVCEQE